MGKKLTKTEKLEKLKQQIKADNEKFETLSKTEQIVIVAKDCIERIKLEQINVGTGNLIKPPHIYTATNNSICEIINSKDDFKCTACAKGGLFLSYVGRVNKMNFIEIGNDNEINGNEHKKLLKLFSLKQLAIIEFAFEGKLYLTDVKIGKDLIKRCVNFFMENGGSYWDIDEPDDVKTMINSELPSLFSIEDTENDELRLIRICENIIENKGVFIP